MYYNAERDISLLTGTPKLDVESIKQIHKTLGDTAPGEIKSAEQLFELFDDAPRKRTKSNQRKTSKRAKS